MKYAKSIDTPIRTSSKLDLDEPDTSVNETTYRGIIGSLLYLNTKRPGIVYSVVYIQDFRYVQRIHI